MFALMKGLTSVVAVLLLLTTTGQSATVTDNLQTTASPLTSLTTQLNNSDTEEPQVLSIHRSCEDEHEGYCENGGQCMYPQDSEKPSCICTSSYHGPRCLFLIEPTQSRPELEKVIGITFGVLMLILILAIVMYCFAYRKCIKSSAPLIKAAPSETSV
ncbi:epigen-like [Solea senegalensis]|uniref:Epigen-like n=2 Tax=Solea senegalensis TaxID=28829 RepID=A0AAV6QET9_SOLSE|nr:epigen-like [Solea senegalensis]KAG7489840.1 epigen-like [Solea senegalensis]